MVFNFSDLMKPKFSGKGNWLLKTTPGSTAPKLVGGTNDVSLAGPTRAVDDLRLCVCGVFGGDGSRSAGTAIFCQ